MREPSGYHWRSHSSPPQLMWSDTVERWKSGSICSRVTLGASTSMTTRLMRKTMLSPGIGYFQMSIVGAPTLVETSAISRGAAVVLERGDLARVGRPGDDGVRAVHPAGVVRRVAEVLDAVG